MAQSAGTVGCYCEMAEWEKGAQGRGYCAPLRWSAVAKMMIKVTVVMMRVMRTLMFANALCWRGIIVAHAAVYFP